ncbi:ABC transporter ATP-binding protein [Haloarculaceae archaeon H-GB2-1]|nr:ABC transporter ATP-binding protein [Haloarculaceae archaeon H-GB1-1]MEA5409669.1 ABC transporter ATP-binding protein [Haloarculaceae archaeon H-GB2-1]
MSRIELRELRKEFGDLVAVEDVSVTVQDGELLCLLGPSGCGKSTTLRMIGGLEGPSDGDVYIGERQVTDSPAYDRNTSIVFQGWELFPHKTVLENVAFGLKMDGVGKDERRERAREMLARVHMDGYQDQNPAELSGGQKQRVALARSLAVDPDVILLDEPLSNLDKRLREEMEIELKEIHEELKKTFIHVTHNQDEAFTLADRIGIMNDGELVQVGPPTEVYQHPKNEFIEGFLGDTNFVGGRVEETDGDEVLVETESDVTVRVPVEDDVQEGDSLTVSLRPEILRIHPTDGDDSVSGQTGRSVAVADGEGSNAVVGQIERVLYRGSNARYFVDVGGTSVFVERSVADEVGLEQGDEVRLDWTADDVLAFHDDGARVST